MPEVVIVAKDGTEHVFPSGFDPKRAAEIVRSRAQAPAPAAAPPQPGSKAAIIMQAASKALPVAETAALNMANSPTLARTTGAIARGATTLGAIGHGAATGNITEVIAAPMAGWTAGKGGYWLGKLMQKHLLMPAAKIAEAVAPYAQALGTLSGAQGVLDLAQMDEPNRTDIGTLGVGKTQDPQARQQFSADWDAWMATYPKSVGKEKWSALNPNQRLDGFKAFMAKQTEGGN